MAHGGGGGEREASEGEEEHRNGCEVQMVVQSKVQYGLCVLRRWSNCGVQVLVASGDSIVQWRDSAQVWVRCRAQDYVTIRVWFLGEIAVEDGALA